MTPKALLLPLILAAGISHAMAQSAAPPAPASRPTPPATQPAGTPATTSAPAISDAQKAAFKKAEAYSRERAGHALLVQKDGAIVFEVYSTDWSAERAHALASGTKSFCGVMAAAAVQDGLLKLDDLASSTLTEWRTDLRKSRITIRQLLSLTSGLDSATRLLQDPSTRNKYRTAVETKAVREPGEVFRYGPSSLECFGELMRRKLAARKQTPLEYIRARVFDPIGLDMRLWRKDLSGNLIMSHGAFLTAREWAKFGEFMRRGGEFGGKQVIDRDALAQCLTGSAANPGYGLTFWLNSAAGSGNAENEFENDEPQSQPAAGPEITTLRRGIAPDAPRDMFMAAGAGGQRLYIIPSQHLVVVRFGGSVNWSDREFLAILLDTAH